jgi:hypothetical protein
MCSLAAAISPGDFGFADWECAAKAPSEIAAKVPIATPKTLIIIFPSHWLILADVRPLSSPPVKGPQGHHIRHCGSFVRAYKPPAPEVFVPHSPRGRLRYADRLQDYSSRRRNRARGICRSGELRQCRHDQGHGCSRWKRKDDLTAPRWCLPLRPLSVL